MKFHSMVWQRKRNLSHIADSWAQTIYSIESFMRNPYNHHSLYINIHSRRRRQAHSKKKLFLDKSVFICVYSILLLLKAVIKQKKRADAQRQREAERDSERKETKKSVRGIDIDTHNDSAPPLKVAWEPSDSERDGSNRAAFNLTHTMAGITEKAKRNERIIVNPIHHRTQSNIKVFFTRAKCDIYFCIAKTYEHHHRHRHCHHHHQTSTISDGKNYAQLQMYSV